MKIAIDALNNSADIERSVMIIEDDKTLFLDLLDFMDNHKSEEYIALNILNDIIISAGHLRTVRRHCNLVETMNNFYSYKVNLPKNKKLPTLQNSRIYANRNHFYLYGDSNGVIYQSYDITRDIIKQWCEVLIIV
jgi:hypothetical protein